MKERKEKMKRVSTFRHLLIAATLFAIPVLASAADETKKAKPYTLDKCVVTDEKLGDHGDPHVFTHEGQEVKLCCKGCLKDFKKEPAKYLKKIEEAGKKTK